MDSETASAILTELRSIKGLLEDLAHMQAAMLQAVVDEDVELITDLDGEMTTRERDQGEPL